MDYSQVLEPPSPTQPLLTTVSPVQSPTVKKNNTTIIFIFILAIIFFIIVIICVIIAYQQSKLPPPPPPIPINNSQLVLQNVNVAPKSITTYDPQTCHDFCLKSPTCLGYYKSPHLSCNIIDNKDTLVTSPGPHTLYIKSLKDFTFTDRVFLSKYSLSFNSDKYFQNVPIGSVVPLKFIPSNFKAPPNIIGIYSKHSFKYSDHPHILKYNLPQYYIHNTNNIINIPPDWREFLPIYVAYLF